MQRTGEKKHRKDKDKNTGGKKKKTREENTDSHTRPLNWLGQC